MIELNLQVELTKSCKQRAPYIQFNRFSCKPELRDRSYELQATSSKLPAMKYKIRDASYELRDIRYKITLTDESTV
jgi:hypothetical protein